MTTFIYGTSDVSSAVGIAEPSDGADPLPFVAFFKNSALPEASFAEIRGGMDAMSMVNRVKECGGVVVYFDNPDSAERIHKLLSVVFSAASRFDWADREEFKETIN